MQVTIELPDDFFTRPKSERELLHDVKEAAAMYWVVKGDIPAARAAEVKAIPGPPVDFKTALAMMPDVGDDADFERPPAKPRTGVEWGT